MTLTKRQKVEEYLEWGICIERMFLECVRKNTLKTHPKSLFREPKNLLTFDRTTGAERGKCRIRKDLFDLATR